jgi:excisionase family DNA binding protein
MNPLLTVKEVAGILRVHPNTVYQKAQSGEIPSIRTSNSQVRFIEKDINEWLDKRSRSPRSIPLFDEALRADLSLENYDKLFLKGGVKVSPKGKTWNYPFGSVFFRLNRSGQERWYIYYRVDGIRIRKAVKNAQSRADALKVLQLEVADAFRGQHGLKKPEKTKTFKEFADQYYESYARINKKSFISDWYMLKQLKKAWGAYDIRQINPLLIEGFRKDLLERGRTRSTTNRYLALLGKMMNLAIDWGLLTQNPVARVKFFSEKANFRETILSLEDEEALLKKCPKRLLPIVKVALNTGMRRGEILGLRWSQVDLAARTIRLSQTKSGRPRVIPINAFLLDILVKQYAKTGYSEFVFPNRATRKPFQDVKRAFNTAATNAGIEGLRFHDLRHTFASRLVAAGVDLITVKDLLGHHSVKVTERYTHTNAEQKKRAVEMLQGLHAATAVPTTSTSAPNAPSTEATVAS